MRNFFFYGNAGDSSDFFIQFFMATPVIRRIFVFRNGDQKAEPHPYVFNNKKIRNFEEFLDDLEPRVGPLRGGIRALFTPSGIRKITNLGDFQACDSENFVAVGEEGFKEISGSYGKPFPDKEVVRELKTVFIR